MEVLTATQAVFVSQDISILELATGCEMRNKYKIYEADPTTRQKGDGYPLFRAVEESSCFMRQCCGPHREFSMDVFQRHPTSESAPGPMLMQLFRPFKCCEILCFNRPEMHVKDPSGLHIARIYNPFTCCDWKLEIGPPVVSETVPADRVHPQIKSDAKGDVWYTLTAAICQPGMFCTCPCGPCERITFDITDNSGTKVGEVSHVWAGCAKELIANADNFVVVFPPDATWYQKAALTSSAILMDFLYFERNQNKNNGS